nr:immunoglobulin light chain junction region [Macaca mulatta]
CMLALEFPYTF